jgi:hypothetical protein
MLISVKIYADQVWLYYPKNLDQVPGHKQKKLSEKEII